MTEKKIRLIAIREKYFYKDLGFKFLVEITEVLSSQKVKIKIRKIIDYTKGSKILEAGINENIKNKTEFEVLTKRLLNIL